MTALGFKKSSALLGVIKSAFNELTPANVPDDYLKAPYEIFFNPNFAHIRGQAFESGKTRIQVKLEKPSVAETPLLREAYVALLAQQYEIYGKIHHYPKVYLFYDDSPSPTFPRLPGSIRDYDRLIFCLNRGIFVMDLFNNYVDEAVPRNRVVAFLTNTTQNKAADEALLVGAIKNTFNVDGTVGKFEYNMHFASDPFTLYLLLSHFVKDREPVLEKRTELPDDLKVGESSKMVLWKCVYSGRAPFVVPSNQEQYTQLSHTGLLTEDRVARSVKRDWAKKIDFSSALPGGKIFKRALLSSSTSKRVIKSRIPSVASAVLVDSSPVLEPSDASLYEDEQSDLRDLGKEMEGFLGLSTPSSVVVN